MEFASAVDALSAAIEFQQAMAEANRDQPADAALVFRMGLHLGDLIVEGDDLYGDGVNVAARLEGEAPAGGILISRNVRDAVAGRVKATFEDLGGLSLKNIERPVRAFRVHWEALDWRQQAASEESVGPAAAPQVPLPLPDKPSIAVLPFQNMSGDPEQDYFADGMVEEIITALSRFKTLLVIARNSSFTFKGRAVDIKEVGRKLGVRYVLEGSVRTAANRVRITGQLVDTATGTHLWADRFDGASGDIFDLQDKVTEGVVGAVAPAVVKAEIERAKRKPTECLDAYDLYLRGLAKYRVTDRQMYDEALRLFYSAIELDPDFASAYGRAAMWYADAKAFGRISGTANEIVEVTRLARRVVELGGDDAMALAAGGWALAYVARDLEVAAALIDRALVLNSNLVNAWLFGGWVKNWLGEPKQAIDRFIHAMRLRPVDSLLNTIRGGIAHAHFFLGRYEEAASWAAMTLQDNSDFQPGLRIAAASNAMAGRLEQAHLAVASLREVNPTLSVSNLKNVLGPYRLAEDLSRYEEGLRKAGLPE
jgi:adenylate cyclase